MDDDWNRAREYLSDLQRAVNQRFGWPSLDEVRNQSGTEVRQHLIQVARAMYPEASQAELDELLDHMNENIAKTRSELPTPFEVAEWYSVMMRCYNSVKKSAQEMGLSIARDPLLGTIATGRVNGLAIAIPDVQTRIVLIEAGLFNFAYLMCKSVAAAIPMAGMSKDGRLSFSASLDDIDRSLEQNSEPIRRFFDALTAYVVRGDAQAAEPYALRGHQIHLADLLRDSMETFIIGHEMGHVTLGHLDGKRALRAVAPDLQAEAIEESWQEEFEADFIGMHLMIRSLNRDRKVDVALSYWGADLFFGCVHVVENAVSILTSGETVTSASETHPPPKMRQMALRQLLLETVQPPSAGEDAAQLANIVDGVVDRFWHSCEPLLRRMHADGIRPALWWSVT